MAREFSLDLRRLERAIRQTPEAAGRGAHKAMDEIKDDWVRESRDIAPLDTRALRDNIEGKVSGSNLNSEIVVVANAKTKGNFNYAYFIHEHDAGGRDLRTPGTEKKFLDKASEERQSEWARWLEEEIVAELRREGW